MPELKSKKFKICFVGSVVSLIVLLLVFGLTDKLMGDKEFSEYTPEDWKVAAVPLSALVISLISTLVFTLLVAKPFIAAYPALLDYLNNKKFADLDMGTEFLVFDHDEAKRTCCTRVNQTGLRISVKEYNLKTRSWTVLEYGRILENKYSLEEVLKTDYGYDRIKYFDIYGNASSSKRPYQMP